MSTEDKKAAIPTGWTDLRGKIHDKWEKFTEKDLDGFKGNLKSVAQKVEQVYGYSKEKADQEFRDFKASLNNR